MWADKGLPDIGDDRRDDDDGQGVSRRHRDREQAHRHRWQAEPDHTLDEPRKREHRGDVKNKGVRHAGTLTDRRDRHNLEVMESAFGHAEGRGPRIWPCGSTWLTSDCSSRWPKRAA